MDKCCETCEHIDTDYYYDGEDEIPYYTCRLSGAVIDAEEVCSLWKKFKVHKYKEKDTKCDSCEFLSTCDVMDVTGIEDSRRHWLPNLGVVCKKK